MDGKFGNFELNEDEVDIYAQAPGTDEGRWLKHTSFEILDQRNEKIPHVSAGPAMALRPRFAR